MKRGDNNKIVVKEHVKTYVVIWRTSHIYVFICLHGLFRAHVYMCVCALKRPFNFSDM